MAGRTCPSSLPASLACHASASSSCVRDKQTSSGSCSSSAGLKLAAYAPPSPHASARCAALLHHTMRLIRSHLLLPATAAAASVGATRANALLGPDGALLVAIVMGGILNETRVALSAALASQFVVSACSVAHAVATRDAQPQWAGRPWQARARGNGTGVVLGVPLQHGCALLRCEKK